MASPLDKNPTFGSSANHNISNGQSQYQQWSITISPMVGVLVIDLRLHRHSLGFFGARKLDTIEGVAMFDDLKGFDDAFRF